jgi:FSR family fosmidomycin resistance protein-like MFS transporter
MQKATAETRPIAPATAAPALPPTVLAVLFAISFSHLLNDTIQALIPSIYPMLKDSFNLSFAKLGWITFTFQCTASLFQPIVGWITDKKPMPHSLACGMGLTLAGLIWLAMANDYASVILSAATVGLGSAIFHPEASRVAHMAAGSRRGFAQSLFQLGGNTGSALGPFLAALIVTTHGRGSLAWFSVLAMLGVIVLWKIGTWQKQNFHRIRHKSHHAAHHIKLSRGRVTGALAVLVVLIFSKYVYLTSMTSYYTFYLIHHFGVSVKTSQLLLFVFLFAVALGTIIGGPVGDRIGRKRVIWVSILGVAPFTLALPYVGLTGVVVLTVFIGVILASAFSAILVYAQELVPGKVGMIAGLFFGLAFGIAGIGSAALGNLADHTSIEFVFRLCAYLPLLGLLTVLLPDMKATERH